MRRARLQGLGGKRREGGGRRPRPRPRSEAHSCAAYPRHVLNPMALNYVRAVEGMRGLAQGGSMWKGRGAGKDGGRSFQPRHTLLWRAPQSYAPAPRIWP